MMPVVIVVMIMMMVVMTVPVGAGALELDELLLSGAGCLDVELSRHFCFCGDVYSLARDGAVVGTHLEGGARTLSSNL